MPAYSSDTQKYHRERVRSIMVLNPMLAGEHIRRQLSQQGLVLDRNYINGIVNDIHRQRARRVGPGVARHRGEVLSGVRRSSMPG